MKILNLYAGIGGNRKLWGDEHEVTAVEINPEIAAVYQDLYPNDEVVIGDAHQYLLEHFKEFDFIWSSPPCQSHSSFRFNIGVRYRGVKPVFPDMTLYEEILFLRSHAECNWVVENVKPYYKPLIEAKLIQRHMFWSNFELEDLKVETDKIRTAQIPDLQKLHGIDLSNYKIKDKRQILRNCVHKEVGLHILNCSQKCNIKNNSQQGIMEGQGCSSPSPPPRGPDDTFEGGYNDLSPQPADTYSPKTNNQKKKIPMESNANCETFESRDNDSSDKSSPKTKIARKKE